MQRAEVANQRRMPCRGGLSREQMEYIVNVFAIRSSPRDYDKALADRMTRLKCLRDMYQARYEFTRLEHAIRDISQTEDVARRFYSTPVNASESKSALITANLGENNDYTTISFDRIDHSEKTDQPRRQRHTAEPPAFNTLNFGCSRLSKKRHMNPSKLSVLDFYAFPYFPSN